MFTARNYVKAASLEEAWTLNQKRSNGVLGGGCWMRLARRRYDTLIDLSGLGLEGVREEDGALFLGAMTTLREVEESPVLRGAFGGYFKDCTRHIVGVQFRNCATLGGSVRSRFGFSDVLTALLPLPGAAAVLYKGGSVPLTEYVNMEYDRDLLLGVRLPAEPRAALTALLPLPGAAAVLYKGGSVPLTEYVNMEYDRDLLLGVRLPAEPRAAVYESVRNSETDLSVLTCGVCRTAEGYRAAIGARPGRAALLEGGSLEALTEQVEQLHYGTNLRAGAAYRQHLSGVLLKRALGRLEEAER